MPTSSSPMLDELVALIGVTATIALVENFGGTRLYCPTSPKPNSELGRCIGIEATKKLCGIYSPDMIRVPLARDLRAIHYRGQGLSNGRIASRLGITETGVDKIFARLVAAGVPLPRKPTALALPAAPCVEQV